MYGQKKTTTMDIDPHYILMEYQIRPFVISHLV